MLERLLRDLTALIGPCGHEHDVVRYIVEQCKSISAATVTVDGIGNVIVRKKGAHVGAKLVVAAHMDEVGFIVKKIEANGLLRFEKLGGHDDRILLAERVRVRTEQGVCEGVIGTISAHMVRFDDAVKVRKYAEMYIDIGASSREEAIAMGVQIGDVVAYATDCTRLGPHRMVGKSFDDRAGCAVLLHTMQNLDYTQVHGEIIGVFSVQEEVGLRGARVAAAAIDADVALAIDTTAVSDTPEAMMDDTLRLGAGPAVKLMDFSLIASVAVRKRLLQVATRSHIPHQLEIFTGIGTDAGELHMANGGVPTGVISIPSRYAHSSVEVIDLRDLENTHVLLTQFIYSLRSGTEFAFLSESEIE